jgi:hypothetical protein
MGTKPIDLPGVRIPPPLPGTVNNPPSVKMSSFKNENKNAIKTIRLTEYDPEEAFMEPNPTRAFESETGKTFEGKM